MSIDSRHDGYLFAEQEWLQVRDCVAGARKIKAARERYLPKLDGVSEAEWEGYVQRALFFNATQRTHDSFVGLIMGKEPVVDISPGLKALSENFDGSGFDLTDFTQRAVSELLITGRGLALVDYPQRPDSVQTLAEARAAGMRPYALWYPAESILDWRTEVVNGERRTVFLKLKETFEAPQDEWTMRSADQLRVCNLTKGRYRVRVFRKDGDHWKQVDESFPRGRDGVALPRIPCAWFGPTNGGAEVEKSPLYDLSETNISHYRNSADHEHGCHFTGLPQLYVSGYQPENGESIRVGSTVAHCFPDPAARMAYASFGGEGLASLREAMSEKERYMAALGARMLVREGAASESAEALAIRRKGENSALAKLAASASSSIEETLIHMAEWAGVSGPISFELNKDYVSNEMTPQEITAALQAWQSGAISYETLFGRFKRGGLIPAQRAETDEREAIDGFGLTGADVGPE